MTKNQLHIIEEQLYQITNTLILNGTLTECSGLIHGKMGIAIFFFYYAKYTKNTIFTNYAFNLIEEIQKQLHKNSPTNYERGLAGIAVGLDYLIQKKFLIAEDNICEELDQHIYYATFCNLWEDLSLYTGKIGYGRYWITRIKNKSSFELAQKSLLYIVNIIKNHIYNMSIEDQIDTYYFLHNLIRYIKNESIEKILMVLYKKYNTINFSIPRLEKSFVSLSHLQFHQNKENIINQRNKILQYILKTDITTTSMNMGLFSGYAGEGLLRLHFLNTIDSSWTKLL